MRTAQEREDDTRPLINTLIRLRSGHRSFETKTDVHGVYAFNRLPPGTWQVSADLPPNLELAELIGPDAARPFELPRRSCFEHDFYALPTGRISGRVIGPDGTPLRTDVDLYRAGQYSEGARGMLNLHGHLDPAPDGHSFVFRRRLRPGV